MGKYAIDERPSVVRKMKTLFENLMLEHKEILKDYTFDEFCEDFDEKNQYSKKLMYFIMRDCLSRRRRTQINQLHQSNASASASASSSAPPAALLGLAPSIGGLQFHMPPLFPFTEPVDTDEEDEEEEEEEEEAVTAHPWLSIPGGYHNAFHYGSSDSGDDDSFEFHVPVPASAIQQAAAAAAQATLESSSSSSIGSHLLPLIFTHMPNSLSHYMYHTSSSSAPSSSQNQGNQDDEPAQS